jgi:hypothetical protein
MSTIYQLKHFRPILARPEIFQGKLLSLPVDLVGKLNAIQHAPDDEIRVRDVRRLMQSWRKFRDDMGWDFDEVLGFQGVKG